MCVNNYFIPITYFSIYVTWKTIKLTLILQYPLQHVLHLQKNDIQCTSPPPFFSILIYCNLIQEFCLHFSSFGLYLHVPTTPSPSFPILYYCNLLQEFCFYFSSFGLYVQKLFVQEVITPILVT